MRSQSGTQKVPGLGLGFTVWAPTSGYYCTTEAMGDTSPLPLATLCGDLSLSASGSERPWITARYILSHQNPSPDPVECPMRLCELTFPDAKLALLRQFGGRACSTFMPRRMRFNAFTTITSAVWDIILEESVSGKANGNDTACRCGIQFWP